MQKEQRPQRPAVSFSRRPWNCRRGTTDVVPFLALVVVVVVVAAMGPLGAETMAFPLGAATTSKQQQQQVLVLRMATPLNDDESLSSSSSDEWQSNQRNDPRGSNPNTWRSSDDDNNNNNINNDDGTRLSSDWQATLESKQDGSFWSQFELPPENDNSITSSINNSNNNNEDEMEWVDDSEVWLNTLASISAEEVEFNMVEANRADKAREMADWGFDVETIKNTFGIAVDDSLEKEEVEGMKAFRDESYLDDEDWKLVESHSRVETDPDTGEPFRQQMVSRAKNNRVPGTG